LMRLTRAANHIFLQSGPGRAASMLTSSSWTRAPYKSTSALGASMSFSRLTLFLVLLTIQCCTACSPSYRQLCTS
jgi:hypothetical protein